MKFRAYAGVSFVIALSTVLHAWHTRVDYYPTVVYMTTNKLAQIAIGNWVLVMSVAFGKMMRKIFLGPLRDIEIEVMYENARYAITETCLALTVFRGDLTSAVIALFTQLLFVKSFHWLAQARVEHLEQAGGQSLTSMARLTSLVVLTLVVDGTMLKYCLENIALDQQPSVLVLFAFEYAILSVAAIATIVHLVLHVVDISMAGAWHGKATWTMLLEFFSEVLKFSFYTIFFLVMLMFYGVLPIHLVRDVYMSFVQVQRRLQAIIRYQRLAATMDQRLPAATEEELEECEHTCIICRDTMTAGKKLPCSHIFHFQCLRLWLQQQQACPTCRADIPTHDSAATAAAAEQRAAAAELNAQPQPAVIAEPAQDVATAAGAADVAASGHTGGGGAGAPPVAVPRMTAKPPTAPVPGSGSRQAREVAPRGGGSSEFGSELGTPRPGVSYGRSSIGWGATGSAAASCRGSGFSLDTVNRGPSSIASPGFSALIEGGMEERAEGGVLPAGMMLHALLVISRKGTVVRSGIDSNATPCRTEPCGSVLLLMAPPGPCGSFAVYGGWVGGPGRDGDVRLVDIAEPSFGQSEPWSYSATGGGKARAEQDQNENNARVLDGGQGVIDEDEIPHGDGIRRRHC